MGNGIRRVSGGDEFPLNPRRLYQRRGGEVSVGD
jgi:hypothetical protein